MNNVKYYMKSKNIERFILALQVRCEYPEFIYVHNYNYLRFWTIIITHQSWKISLQVIDVKIIDQYILHIKHMIY